MTPFNVHVQRNAIREYTGVMGWSKQARHIAAEAGCQAARVMATAG